MTQSYAETWNLDFKPNMEIWDKIESKFKQGDRCGSINMPGLLLYLRCSLENRTITALERRKLRKQVKDIIEEMNRVEQQILFKF
jgi:hypothetical protein